MKLEWGVAAVLMLMMTFHATMGWLVGWPWITMSAILTVGATVIALRDARRDET